MLTLEDSFDDLLHSYLEELELHQFSQSSVWHASRVLSLLFEHLGANGIEDVRAVREEHLVGFVRNLQRVQGVQGKPLSSGTQSTYVSTMKRFFAFLDKRSILLHNPAARIRLPRIERLPRSIPSQPQVRRLLDMPPARTAIGMRDRAILETLYGTALRLGECRRLNVHDIDLQKGSLWVRSGKGRKDRLLPIPRKAVRVIDHYLKVGRPVLLYDPKEQAFYLSRIGHRISTAAVNQMIRECGRAAGLAFRLHAHAFRHACATHLLQRGADLRHVQELLGHSQIATTAIYTKVQIDDLKEVVRKKHPRERRYRKKK